MPECGHVLTRRINVDYIVISKEVFIKYLGKMEVRTGSCANPPGGWGVGNALCIKQQE